MHILYSVVGLGYDPHSSKGGRDATEQEMRRAAFFPAQMFKTSMTAAAAMEKSF